MFQSSPEIEQVMFVQRVIDLLVSRPDKMDQDAVLTALTNWNGPPLPLYIFPPHLVQNGWQVQCSRPTTPTISRVQPSRLTLYHHTYCFCSFSFAGYPSLQLRD
jgi:hypothetical protein